MLKQAPLNNSFRFCQVRERSERLCQSLSAEDCNLQAMPDTSPLKWHLAHTTWFFETFILLPFSPGYRVHDEAFQVLFNSYYNGIGKQHPRPQRHLLSRPGLEAVMDYRRAITDAMVDLLEGPGPSCEDVETGGHVAQQEIGRRLALGLNHEQQHQELMLTDLKYNFSCNPLSPVYFPGSLPSSATPASPAKAPGSAGFEFYKGGLVDIGQSDQAAFGFDNEFPRHRVWLEPFALARRLVSNGEFRAFIEDGGYQRPELWLADGWAWVQAQNCDRPLYWCADLHSNFTLHGLQPLVANQPACHLSYFEADAYARWDGARLPTEAEWEHACRQAAGAGKPPADSGPGPGLLHPTSTAPRKGLADLFGQVWQWTSSAYAAYPCYRVAAGALGEYNGKFMCNQFVLRGSSCVTPTGHSRPSYRNFFYAPDRWQFSGLRLARDAMPGNGGD